MNFFARIVARYIWQSMVAVILLAALAGWTTSEVTRHQRELERLSLLETEADRRGIEIMSQTLNGNVMGALGLLGTIDHEIKREARGGLTGKHKGEALLTVRGKTVAVSEINLANLESIGRSYDAEGTFVVRNDGWIGSGWDNSGKPSTGLNVKFRPYYQMAMQGMENVYAAVSQARGDRMLYFSAPIFAETTNGTEAIGAVVARTGLIKIDNLLRGKADISLLLSPQEIVFASSRPEWIGKVAGTLTPERLQSIRDIKQFGDMFAIQAPQPLPVTPATGIHLVDGKPHAIAGTKVQWNDPLGDWTLWLMEDLSRTVPLADRLRIGLFAAVLVFVLGIMLIRMLRGHHGQQLANAQVSAYAEAQQLAARHKAELASVGLQMQQCRTVEDVLQCYFEATHRLFGVLQGVAYRADPLAAQLKLAGSYACAEAMPAQLGYGEGLLGQCAIERKVQVFDIGRNELAVVRSGLGGTSLVASLLAPVTLHEEVLGVVELGMLHRPDEAELARFGEITGLLAMNLEIVGRTSETEAMLTASQQADRLHAEQIAFQQALIDTIPYPVFYKGPDTRFQGFNRAYEATFNVRREDLIGKRVLELDYLSEADRLAYQSEDEAVIASAGSIKREMKIPFADGQLHDTIYYVSGFQHQDGSPGGLVGTFIDVTAMKNAEREMDRLADLERFHRLAQGRERRILELKHEVNALAKAAGQPAPYNTDLVEPVGDHEVPPHPDYRTDLASTGQSPQLKDLVDLGELQVLLSNFCESVGIASAIIDLDGKVLAAARWQRACTGFHRVNADSCQRCIESDTELALQLQEGQDFTVYKCKNGMTDAAAPIVVEGCHLANVFIGQFHSASPDIAFFRKQAQQFGYDEQDYLAAVMAAPVIDEARLPAILSFLSGFARMISTMSLARRRADSAQQALQDQALLLKRERVAALSLAEDAEQARIALEALAKESQA